MQNANFKMQNAKCRDARAKCAGNRDQMESHPGSAKFEDPRFAFCIGCNSLCSLYKSLIALDKRVAC